MDVALTKMSAAITLCPTYASAYNNRAQIHRIKGDFESAMLDVCEAIRLCESTVADGGALRDPSLYSRSTMNVLKQAYAQRGALFKRKGQHEEAAVSCLRCRLRCVHCQHSMSSTWPCIDGLVGRSSPRGNVRKCNCQIDYVWPKSVRVCLWALPC